jgi:hypothetical protein
MRGKSGSVVVCLGDLPPRLTAKELKAFVQDAIQADDARGLRIRSSICDCSILRITDLNTGCVELRGLLEIRPAVLAIRAIERLNGLELRGKPIVARRYRQPSPMSSVRPSPKADKGNPETGATLAECRWDNLKIELADSEPGFLSGLTGPLQRPWRFWLHRPPGSTAT